MIFDPCISEKQRSNQGESIFFSETTAREYLVIPLPYPLARAAFRAGEGAGGEGKKAQEKHT